MWPTIWQCVLWIALVLYFGVAIVVAIGGIGDLARLFARIRAEPYEEGFPPEDTDRPEP